MKELMDRKEVLLIHSQSLNSVEIHRYIRGEIRHYLQSFDRNVSFEYEMSLDENFEENKIDLLKDFNQHTIASISIKSIANKTTEIFIT